MTTPLPSRLTPLPWSTPFAWFPGSDDGDLHVTGTHDLDTARHHATTFLTRELGLTASQATAALAGHPHPWWALPNWPDGPDGDVWFSPVSDATPGGVPTLTWALRASETRGEPA
jgi:hypothetical protein